MNNRGINSKYFFWSIPACIILSVLSTSIFSHYSRIKITDEFKAMEFVIDSNVEFDGSLYYSYSDRFSSKSQILDTNKSKDTLVFLFPRHNETVKKFRLDFGSNPHLKKVKIKSLHLIFNNDLIKLNAPEVFDNLYLNSGSVALNKAEQEFIIRNNDKPFDPYVVFMPLGEISKSTIQYLLALLLPFVIMVLCYCYLERANLRMTIKELLLLLFIACIPLKIAWTTFVTLLLVGYVVYLVFIKKKLEFDHSGFIILVSVFTALLIFGRPSSFQDISKELAILLFAILSTAVFTGSRRTYWHYGLIFLVLNAIVVASGISFLLWFKEFYGLGILDYFDEIKIYSGQTRDWLYYDHAAFLSFFGLVGLLFFHKLYDTKLVDKGLLLLYHTILILFIVLGGSRISVLIYIIYLLNLLVRINIKRRIIANFIVLIGFLSLIFKYIEKIDDSRFYLWKISWTAIKDRPWFGYGLDKSSMVLQKQNLMGSSAINNLELNHSHNQYLTGLIEIGFIGVFAIIILLVFFLIRTQAYKNKMLLLFITGLGYIFLTESILQTSKPLYVICFLFLLIISDSINEVRENSP